MVLYCWGWGGKGARVGWRALRVLLKDFLKALSLDFLEFGRCSRLKMGTSGTRSGGLRKGQSPHFSTRTLIHGRQSATRVLIVNALCRASGSILLLGKTDFFQADIDTEEWEG